MLTPRQSVLIGLLAIIPAAVYVAFRPGTLTAIAILNVFIITYGLYVAFQPTEHAGEHGEHPA